MKLTSEVIGCAIRVHRCRGSGFLESVYQSALEYEFSRRGIIFERHPKLNVWYGDHLAGTFIADFVVEEKVLVELKAVRELKSTFDAQLLNYLSASRLTLGLNLNFGSTKLQIKRRVLNFQD